MSSNAVLVVITSTLCLAVAAITSATVVHLRRKKRRRTQPTVWSTRWEGGRGTAVLVSPALEDQHIYIVAKDEHAARVYARDQQLFTWRYVKTADHLRGRSLRASQIVRVPGWRDRRDSSELADAILLSIRIPEEH